MPVAFLKGGGATRRVLCEDVDLELNVPGEKGGRWSECCVSNHSGMVLASLHTRSTGNPCSRSPMTKSDTSQLAFLLVPQLVSENEISPFRRPDLDIRNIRHRRQAGCFDSSLSSMNPGFQIDNEELPERLEIPKAP